VNIEPDIKIYEDDELSLDLKNIPAIKKP